VKFHFVFARRRAEDWCYAAWQRAAADAAKRLLPFLAFRPRR